MAAAGARNATFWLSDAREIAAFYTGDCGVRGLGRRSPPIYVPPQIDGVGWSKGDTVCPPDVHTKARGSRQVYGRRSRRIPVTGIAANRREILGRTGKVTSTGVDINHDPGGGIYYPICRQGPSGSKSLSRHFDAPYQLVKLSGSALGGSI